LVWEFFGANGESTAEEATHLGRDSYVTILQSDTGGPHDWTQAADVHYNETTGELIGIADRVGVFTVALWTDEKDEIDFSGDDKLLLTKEELMIAGAAALVLLLLFCICCCY
jgi:hypothetical protein